MHIKRFPVLPIVVRLLKTFLRLQNFYWNLLHLLVQVVRLLSNFFETVCIKPVILRRPVPSVCVRMSTCVCVCVWMSLILYCLHRAARDALKFEILLILFAVRFTTSWHRHRILTHFWPLAVCSHLQWSQPLILHNTDQNPSSTIWTKKWHLICETFAQILTFLYNHLF